MQSGRTTKVSVRPAEPRDRERLWILLGQLGYGMEREAFDARIAGISGKVGQLLVVAELEYGEVVGLLHAYERPSIEKPPEVTIQAMVVDEACRSAGIGEALVGAATAWARSQGYNVMGLHTHVKRERAQAFYERQGFEEVAKSVLYRCRLDK